jgi:hypothetical protein
MELITKRDFFSCLFRIYFIKCTYLIQNFINKLLLTITVVYEDMDLYSVY